jgi:4-amino-4-deoxy-L-arabinose transferase-like glycosyltransferase
MENSRSETAPVQQRPVGRATAILLGLAALPGLIAAVTRNTGYGYFSDEFYYLACSDHLAWGYVDHPPLSIALLALIRTIFGDNIWALHLLPPLAVAGAVFLTGLMARRLGAGTFGQALAALAAVVTPTYLIFARDISMNAFDLLFWTLGAYVILGILKNDTPKGWLLFGLIAGLGLLNKVSMGFFGLGLCVALLLTNNRKYIMSRVDGKFRPGLHLWSGGVLAFLIFLPHLIWQIQNEWPTIEFMRNSIALHGASPLGFLLSQLLGMHPFNFPIWLAGLYFYLFSQRGKPYRMMGIIYVSIFILLILQGTRAYYLHVAYPMLFAGGAVLIESFAERGKWRGRILKPVIVTALVALTALMLPGFLPVMPPKQLLALQESAGIPAEVPQIVAVRLCWEEFVAEVARVYETLPEEDRKESVIFTDLYHTAGAIDFLGKKYGLPPATSNHNNYWLWGPGDTSWNVVIAVGVPKASLERMFGEVVEAGRTSCEYTDRMSRNDAPVYVCREPKRPIAEVWAGGKKFD